MVTTTLTRREPTVQYFVDAHDVRTSVADQLSSPISSYEFYQGPEGPCIRHQDAYSVRLKSAKERIQQLEDDVKYLMEADRQRSVEWEQLKEADRQRSVEWKHLKEADMQRQKISIDWEIRSRIAQALNDSYMRILPSGEYSRLKAAGHGYLPYLLTAWAMIQGQISMPSENEEDQLDKYTRKISSLYEQHLINDVSSIWNAMPPDARNLMTAMWVKRDPSRSGIAHPTPSVEQALSLIRLDCDLTAAEIRLAETVISVAVSKQGNRLFGDDGIS